MAVPLENDDGERSHAATSVTMMTLSGQSDDSTRLGYNVVWVPTHCIHAERSDDGSLRTWISMFSPEVRGAFANIGLHYQPSEAYESHLYQLEVLDEDLQSSEKRAMRTSEKIRSSLVTTTRCWTASTKMVI